MSPREDHDSANAAVAAAFLQRYLADVETGSARSLADYQAQWPEHADLITSEYAALTSDASNRTESGQLPASIGGFRIERELGRGGQGVVYLAHDHELGRHLALKVLDLGRASEEMLARFRREAAVAARLDHPGICGVLDTGFSEGRAWIAMRYVEGETLSARIARAKPTPPERDEVLALARLFQHAATALAVAHDAGVVHRDLKPSNVMIDPSGQPVLLDFGLAGDESGVTLTQTGDLFGTPAYMAPEQIAGKSSGDRLSDIYSLGATLFEALVLEPPFPSPTREAMYRAILEDDPPRLSSKNANVPLDLEVVVATALDRDLDRRYQTPADLAEDLRRVCEGEPILAKPPGPLGRASRWVRRNPVVTSLATGLFLTLTGGLLYVSDLLGEVIEAKGQLESQLEDVNRGRAKKLADEIRTKLERGFSEAMGATVGDSAATFEEVLALDPTNKQALLGRVFVADEKEKAATLERLSGPLANDLDIVWMHGFLRELAGREAEAQSFFERAGDRESALRLYLMGLREIEWFRPPGDPDASRRAHTLFRRAVSHAETPQFHYTHSLLMSSAYARDRDAMDEAAEILEFHWPDNPATWDAIAQFYSPIEPERAEDAMHRHLDLVEAAAPCCGLAQLAMRRGEMDLAREWYDRAIAYEDDFAPAWYLRGTLALRENDTEAARLDFLAAIERDPTYPPSYSDLANLHRARGDLEAARRDFESMIEAHPDVPYPAQHLARLEEALE